MPERVYRHCCIVGRVCGGCNSSFPLRQRLRIALAALAALPVLPVLPVLLTPPLLLTPLLTPPLLLLMLSLLVLDLMPQVTRASSSVASVF